MSILKGALLGSLRIAFFGTLKVTLFVYTLFLSDTVVSALASDGNGPAGGVTPETQASPTALRS
jgi:hypothetical protein